MTLILLCKTLTHSRAKSLGNNTFTWEGSRQNREPEGLSPSALQSFEPWPPFPPIPFYAFRGSARAQSSLGHPLSVQRCHCSTSAAASSSAAATFVAVFSASSNMKVPASKRQLLQMEGASRTGLHLFALGFSTLLRPNLVPLGFRHIASPSGSCSVRQTHRGDPSGIESLNLLRSLPAENKAAPPES